MHLAHLTIYHRNVELSSIKNVIADGDAVLLVGNYPAAAAHIGIEEKQTVTGGVVTLKTELCGYDGLVSGTEIDKAGLDNVKLIVLENYTIDSVGELFTAASVAYNVADGNHPGCGLISGFREDDTG